MNWREQPTSREKACGKRSSAIVKKSAEAQNAWKKGRINTLNRSLETFLTRLPRTSECSEKSRRVFKTPRYYKVESDGCIDTWIEVMKLHFEEEDLTERQECSALTSNLEGTALNCVMAKKQYQWDTAEKIFEILLNSFGSGYKVTKQ